MSQMNPKKFLYNTAISFNHRTVPVTPFKPRKSTMSTTKVSRIPL